MCRDAKDKCHMKLFLVSFNWKLNLVSVYTTWNHCAIYAFWDGTACMSPFTQALRLILRYLFLIILLLC